jgi:eukaryotic-like serine/threonine-protein kinase
MLHGRIVQRQLDVRSELQQDIVFESRRLLLRVHPLLPSHQSGRGHGGDFHRAGAMPMNRSEPSAPSPSMPYPPGTVLAGKYRVERLLGEGGMGWVVVATHLQLEQRVAVKFLHASHARDTSEAVPRFLREARAAARIQSEHVARVSDFGTLDNGAPYLVMEYLEGEDLESLLRTRGALPADLVVDYAMQACEGLGEAHAAGIVHRDLKPANLFLAKRSDGSVRVKLLDFGISKLAAPAGAPEVAMTSTQALMGSPLYMAPEQMRSSKKVDGRADIWSMGVILYEMLAGRPPFDGETLPVVCARILAEPPTPLRSVQSNVPPALEAVVMRCLEKEPQQRFYDVAALARALAPFGTPEAQSAAERIGRVARVRTASLPEIVPGGTGRHLEANGQSRPQIDAWPSGIAQTRAEFSKTGRASSGRLKRRALPLAIGGGTLFVVAAILIGLVATRGSSRGIAPSSASRVGETAIATPTVPTATLTPTATATLTPTATATHLPTADPPPTARPSAPPAALQPPPRQSPHAKPAASAPKPAATAAFGGRD